MSVSNSVQWGTIANGAQNSGTFDMQSVQPVAILTPAAMTGTTLTFISVWNGVSYPVYTSAGTLYSVTIGTSEARQYALDLPTFAGVRHLIVRSGSAEGAARAIGVVVRPVG